MATVKKDIITFASGRVLNVPGGIISITRNLELADYYSRNILFFDAANKNNQVVNIYHLSKEELIEIADLMIQLWIELKDNIRQFDITNPAIFKMKRQNK